MSKDYVIIDDSEIDILIVSRMIAKKHPELNPIALSDGVKGIDYLKKVIKNEVKKPNIILLDLQMPLMDGFEFLEIYEHDFFQKLRDVKLIILTSSIHQIDKQKAEKYKSVAAYMIKPFSLEDFKYFV